MSNINVNVENCLNSLDTYIDVLRKESAKLSGMIEKLNNKIKEVEAAKEQLIKEQNEPKFEIVKGEEYYYINFLNTGFNMVVQKDKYLGGLEKARVDQNNCFKTEERAREVLDKIELLLKLERLHDIYCPDYKPNWDRDFIKHYVCYDTSKEKWSSCSIRAMKDAVQVYFPTSEIAQKVCNILNREEQNNESNA